MKLRVFSSLTGDTALGFERTDSPLVHVIAQAPPGTPFEVESHFAVCEVCKAHGVTLADFSRFMRSL